MIRHVHQDRRIEQGLAGSQKTLVLAIVLLSAMLVVSRTVSEPWN